VVFSLGRFSGIFFIVTNITINTAIGLNPTNDSYPDTFFNATYTPELHTVLLHNTDWEFSLPVIEAGSSQQLELRFDMLSKESQNLGYTLVLCNAGWKKSDLLPEEYLSGFGNGTIRESTPSFNTTYDYIHYRLVFPEEECTPLLSGNYALVVYEQDNPEKILLSRRFYVVENKVQIEASVKQPLFGNYKETGQQVEITVLHNGGDVHDPLSEVKVIVLQNGRDDNMVILGKPSSITPGRLEYAGPDQGIFQGGNEFRSLDIKSMKYQTENIAAIDFQSPYYHVFMKPDEDRGGRPYFSKTDLNGNYYIDSEKTEDRHTETDYVFVHFNLGLPLLYAMDDIYITGAFCNWTRQEGNKMAYNDSKNIFESKLLLKQGLYDYCFATADPETGQINEYALEGNFYETENDYSIFVYFHDPRDQQDKLIGYLPIK
jgi:hypothetical protein